MDDLDKPYIILLISMIVFYFAFPFLLDAIFHSRSLAGSIASGLVLLVCTAGFIYAYRSMPDS